MAKRIEQQLGRNALIDIVGNPYGFLLAYQEAAKQIGNPKSAYVFDEQVLCALANALCKETGLVSVIRDQSSKKIEDLVREP
ncbi:MAG: hypothetical protein GWP06_17465 [Actinobacteria bacterium]|nr:hypothetical protein [Actinomycetota bacterium]